MSAERTTTADVKAAERRLGYARATLDTAESALRARHAAISEGKHAAEAATLRAALGDPALVSALNAADAAAARVGTAESELRRCRSRGYRRTALADEREGALRAARLALGAELAVLSPLLAARGVPPTGGATFGPRHTFTVRERLRALEELCYEGRLPEDVNRARAEVEKAEHALEDVRSRLVPEAEVAALARGLDRKALDLLAKLVGGYEPKPATVRGKPLYRELEGAGLVAAPYGRLRVTPLGGEVLRWASKYLPAVSTTKLAPPPAWARWRTSHPAPERAAMAERALAVLRELRDPANETLGQLVELGDPEAGYSYRLVRTREVLQWFLKVLEVAPDADEVAA